MPPTPPSSPADLTAAIDRAGYYPALVADVVLRGPRARAVVDRTSCTSRRPSTATSCAATSPCSCSPRRGCVIAHADDHADEPPAPQDVATATTESIPLSAVRGVMLTHVVDEPDDLRARQPRPRDHPHPRLGRRRAGSTSCPARAATPTATPTTASRAPSPATTSRCASRPPPTARTPCPQALAFARDLSAAIGQG